jgi:hypothetical protein
MAHRFFIFLPNGIFLDEIEFEEAREERESQQNFFDKLKEAKKNIR